METCREYPNNVMGTCKEYPNNVVRTYRGYSKKGFLQWNVGINDVIV